MTETHARFSPSKLPRIVRCPGSVREEESCNIVKTTSSYAEEGTMLHAATEDCLEGRHSTVPEYIITKYDMTKEHVEAVQEVIDWVAGQHFAAEDDEDRYEVIEAHCSLEPYVEETGCELLSEVAGTLDYSLVLPAARTLIVADWKYGKGIEVFPDTEQLKAYALGRLVQVCKKTEIDKVIVVIGQPRLYVGELFKVEETTPEELEQWLKTDLVPALNNTMAKHPTFNPTPKGCMWCAIKNTCSHRRKVIMEIAEEVFKVHAEQNTTADEEISTLLKRAPMLKSYLSDIEKHVKGTIMGGKEFPGFKLVAGRSVRVWKNPDEAMKFFLNSGIDDEELVVAKFKTPPQIEKTIGKKNMTDEMLDLIHKPEGSPTLVKDTDKREPLVFEDAETKFKDYAK